MKPLLHRLQVALKAIWLLKRPLIATFTNISTNNSIQLYIGAKGIHRYLLILHQASQKAGANLVIHVNFWDIIRHINHHQGRYHKEIYRTCKLTFARPNSDCIQIHFDYFQQSEGYRIPIGCHPLFQLPTYKPDHPRRTKVNFLGANTAQYAQFRTDIWGMPSRADTLLKIQQKYPHIGRRTSNIEQYAKALRDTQYFICLPGMHMPLCHNFYEAILSGCTPLIHRNYAAWIDPALRQKLLPFTYTTDNQLLLWIEQIENDKFVDNRTELTQPIFELCSQSLSWKSIRKSIETNKEVLICAEESSLELLLQARTSTQ